MSTVEAGIFYPQVHDKHETSPIIDHTANKWEIVRTMGRYVVPFMKAYFSERPITEFGRIIEKNGTYPEFEGVDNFRNKLQEIKNLPEKPHVLVVANHPDFIRSGVREPLWLLLGASVMGEVFETEPHLFVSNNFYIKTLFENTSLIPVLSRSDGGRKHSQFFESRRERINKESLNRTHKALMDSKQQIFFIMPEGETSPGDVLMKGKPNGTLSLIEAAVDNKVPLVVLPIALTQKTVARGETEGIDKCEGRIGNYITAEELLPIEKRAQKDNYEAYRKIRRSVIDSIMTDIADMLPANKRGYYREFVENRESIEKTRSEQIYSNKAQPSKLNIIDIYKSRLGRLVAGTVKQALKAA